MIGDSGPDAASGERVRTATGRVTTRSSRASLAPQGRLGSAPRAVRAATGPGRTPVQGLDRPVHAAEIRGVSVPPPSSSTTAPAVPPLPEHAAIADVPGLIPPRSRGRSTRLIGQVVVELGFAKEEAVERAVMHAREIGPADRPRPDRGRRPDAAAARPRPRRALRRSSASTSPSSASTTTSPASSTRASSAATTRSRSARTTRASSCWRWPTRPTCWPSTTSR